MRFAGNCIECKKSIPIGEQAFWARGVGVKHVECHQPAGDDNIPCAVCGGPAGCGSCELADSCDTKKISPLCICGRCKAEGSMASYMAAVSRKFPILKT